MYRIAVMFLIGLLFCMNATYATEKPTEPDQETASVNYAEVLSLFVRTKGIAQAIAIQNYIHGEPFRQLRAAAEGGNADAQVLLAHAYLIDVLDLEGPGARQRDALEAIRWLKAAAAQGHEYAKKSIEELCTTCERHTSADSLKLGQALERLAIEQIDLAMTPVERRKFVKTNGIQIVKYLRGSYYGWGGGMVYCGERFRVVGDEVWACSPIRALAGENPETTKIFRARLFDGNIEPETTGPCEGEEISSPWPYYVESMIWDESSNKALRTIRELMPMSYGKVKRLSEQGHDRALDFSKTAESARKGNAEAQFKLGNIYSEPESCREELLEAVKWLGKAAGQGHEGAKAALAKVEASLAEMERK